MNGRVLSLAGQYADEYLRKIDGQATSNKGGTDAKIAKKFYGDANKYLKIFEANKDQLKDPDKIKGGHKLKIPE